MRHKNFSPNANYSGNKENRDKKMETFQVREIPLTIHSIFYSHKEWAKDRKTHILLGPIYFYMNVLNIFLIFVHKHWMAQFFNLSQLRSNLFDFWIFVFSLSFFIPTSQHRTWTHRFLCLQCRSKTIEKPRGCLSVWWTYLKFIFEVKLD